ncbi:LacI family DNA-binding transcriptional regulator [Trinickia caryophylli]|uniref:Transcriptional regulator, LacI family n=1 Tax=Trinickia caryophylli TaxID=28094 RepID=A0A1X7FY63_TRICW|nr:LacI family DNA-binding transcriptional regulator [Trinickia caryophylli]WQE11915.1 LacI family DNA-binding transcriptional regulator [Trinickia caryophylli]GLU34576.1 LacI family transcriptional regulator [Trinickia caryophylli]SMF60877.1 transcriptional regulator, LacI family [Trinickia caryophylli]
MSVNPARLPRRATISDVAREAGTGKTSVSRYLNGETNVLSAELRARIEAAIARLDYRPNQMARGLKRGRNRLIGMLVADLTNPYTVEVLRGVEAACHALGLMPLVCNAANELEMERRYVQLMTTYRVEGVIVNAMGVNEETLRPLGASGTPAVLVDRTVAGLEADMVGLDNVAAVELGMHHLIEQGFERIRFVVQPFENVSSRRLRVLAFGNALDAARQAAAMPAWLDGKTFVLDLTDAEAVARTYAEIDADLDAARNGERIAYFAANGLAGLSLALHFHTRYGDDWQRRVALMAIDDPEWAELVGVTTIRQPTYAIGYRAVEFLHERIEGATAPARAAILPGELVVRNSTRRAQ